MFSIRRFPRQKQGRESADIGFIPPEIGNRIRRSWRDQANYEPPPGRLPADDPRTFRLSAEILSQRATRHSCLRFASLQKRWISVLQACSCLSLRFAGEAPFAAAMAGCAVPIT